MVPTIYKAYVRENPPKKWPYMVQYLQFRILEFPLIFEIQFSLCEKYHSFSVDLHDEQKRIYKGSKVCTSHVHGFGSARIWNHIFLRVKPDMSPLKRFLETQGKPKGAQIKPKHRRQIKPKMLKSQVFGEVAGNSCRQLETPEHWCWNVENICSVWTFEIL